jgi:hypothetical protein
MLPSEEKRMPADARPEDHVPSYQFRPIPRNLRHRLRLRSGRLALVTLGLLCAILVPLLWYASGVSWPGTRHGSVAGARKLPADLFIQSVVQDDGALGWRQLCPDLQAQLSQSTLVQDADAQRRAFEQHGVRLTANFISARPQTAGGQLRLYRLTAHWSDGSTQQRTYTVFTQASGCVADVQTQ